MTISLSKQQVTVNDCMKSIWPKDGNRKINHYGFSKANMHPQLIIKDADDYSQGKRLVGLIN